MNRSSSKNENTKRKEKPWKYRFTKVKKKNYHVSEKTGEKYFSVSNRLRKEGRTTEEFEIMLNSIPFEDIISLKIELAARMLNGKFNGFPLWRNILHTVKIALIQYAVYSGATNSRSAHILGITLPQFLSVKKKYGFDNRESSAVEKVPWDSKL